MTGSSSERRSHPRRRIATGGSNPLIATLGVLPRIALICDLCPEGLGVLTTFAPPAGALVPVWLPGPPGRGSALILAAVVHARPSDEDGVYRVGLCSHDEHARAALRDLLSRLGSEPEPPPPR